MRGRLFLRRSIALPVGLFRRRPPSSWAPENALVVGHGESDSNPISLPSAERAGGPVSSLSPLGSAGRPATFPLCIGAVVLGRSAPSQCFPPPLSDHQRRGGGEHPGCVPNYWVLSLHHERCRKGKANYGSRSFSGADHYCQPAADAALVGGEKESSSGGQIGGAGEQRRPSRPEWLFSERVRAPALLRLPLRPPIRFMTRS